MLMSRGVSDHYDGKRYFNPTSHHGPQRDPRRFFRDWLFSRDKKRWPKSIPVCPTRPTARIDRSRMIVTWVGHSTVLVQTEGLNILTDPVWSARPSPFPFVGPRRVREPGVDFVDLPRIDVVLLSHNHYDHLDIRTLSRLWQRDRPIIVTGLGNDRLLKGKGIDCRVGDWGDRIRVAPNAEVILNGVHHWSSRTPWDRNTALWCGFTVELPGGSIFFAGDTGWGDGKWIEKVADAGPFRLALLPIGAYEPRASMGEHHIDPHQAARIFTRIGAEAAMAVHWGTFQLTFEGVDDPPIELMKARLDQNIPAARLFWTNPGDSVSIL
jgi:L-ascorbate metabolism protein UlaG (beta-lactamase superfamily)